MLSELWGEMSALLVQSKLYSSSIFLNKILHQREKSLSLGREEEAGGGDWHWEEPGVLGKAESQTGCELPPTPRRSNRSGIHTY